MAALQPIPLPRISQQALSSGLRLRDPPQLHPTADDHHAKEMLKVELGQFIGFFPSVRS